MLIEKIRAAVAVAAVLALVGCGNGGGETQGADGTPTPGVEEAPANEEADELKGVSVDTQKVATPETK
jgi:hypothetical protein